MKKNIENKMKKEKKLYLFLILFFIFVFLSTFVCAISVSFIPPTPESGPYNKMGEKVGHFIYFMGDNALFIVFILLIISIILTSFLFYTHPAFMVVWVILCIIYVVMGVVLSNTFNEFINTPELSPTTQHLPKTKFIFDHFPLITLVLTIVSIIVIYAKSQKNVV